MSAIGKSSGRLWRHAIKPDSLQHALTVADQVLVCGTSFVTTILIARYSDAAQLGVYAVGISVILSLVAFQDSLIWQPYKIQRPSVQEIPAERAGFALILSLLFSTGIMLLLAVGALGFLKWHGGSEIVLMAFAIMGALPFVLMREFARWNALARFEVGKVILIDLALAMTQLSALGWLGLSGRMSAFSACVALGGASAITVAGWLYGTRAEFSVRMRQVRSIFKQTWAVGKWLLMGRIALQVQKYIAYWFAMLIAGAAVTGVYAACMSILSLLSPLIFALGNVMTPKMQLAWKNDGGPGLWREAVRSTVLIISLMLPLCLAVLVLGETVMGFLFPGTEYEGHRYTLMILALAIFSEALTMPASTALKIFKRPRAIVTIGIVEPVLTVVFVWALMKQWGLLGAACGLLGGAAIAGILRWVAFRIRVPKGRNPALVIRGLQDLTKCADNSSWKITRLGHGLHAETILIQSNVRPIWRNHFSLVTKFYKPLKGVTLRMVQAEFDSLLNLHRTLDGREINGWTVSVPCPLYIHKSPLALTMTEVPGKHIDYYASKNDILTSQNLHDAARAFATTMQQCWSSGERHGDLGVHNVLFDIEGKKISFIDPGTSESCPVCNGSIKPQSLQASDLAHVLYDLSIDVMDMIGSRTMRLHREAFIERVFHAIIENIDPPEEKRWLLDQIWISAQQHLSICLKPSWSLKGMWHGFVNQIMTQRINSILERIMSQSKLYCMAEKS